MDFDGNRSLADTARLRTLDAIHDRGELEIRRERRNTTTERRPVMPRDIFAERQQTMIESGLWPVYTP